MRLSTQAGIRNFPLSSARPFPASEDPPTGVGIVDAVVAVDRAINGGGDIPAAVLKSPKAATNYIRIIGVTTYSKLSLARRLPTAGHRPASDEKSGTRRALLFRRDPIRRCAVAVRENGRL